MPEWSHLPNAKHIDWVLADLKARPESWSAAWDAVRDAARVAAWDAARVAAYDAARVAAWDAARVAAWDAARVAAYDAAWNAAKGAARVAAWSALLALVSYSEAGEFVDHTREQLKALHRLTKHPMYLLLQPLAGVRQNLLSLNDRQST